MKKKISIIILMLLILGCGKSENPNVKEIIYRKGIVYTLDSKDPYSGDGVSYYGKNHIESKGYSTKGKQDGIWRYYYYNGKLKKEGKYIYGEKVGEWTYYNHDGSLEGKSVYINGIEQE